MGLLNDDPADLFKGCPIFVADWFLLMTLNGVLMGYDRTFLGDVLSVTVQLIGMFKCFDKPCE